MLNVDKFALQTMRFAAIEAWPNEAIGVIIGPPNRIQLAIPYQIAERAKAQVTSASSELAEEFWGDWMLGHFHSHPSEVPTLSKDINDPQTDFEEMEEGDFEFIVSLWPTKRGGWAFRQRAYLKVPAGLRDSRVHRRVKLKMEV